jgi:hypothetical protein
MLGKENAFALAQGVAKWLTKFASTNILSPIERRRVNMYKTTRSDKTHSPYLKFAVKGRRSEEVEDSKRQILLKQTWQEIVIMRLVHRTTMQIMSTTNQMALLLHSAQSEPKTNNRPSKTLPNIEDRKLKILQIYRNPASTNFLVCIFRLLY